MSLVRQIFGYWFWIAAVVVIPIVLAVVILLLPPEQSVAVSSLGRVILRNGIAGALVALIGVVIAQYLTGRRHSQALEHASRLEAQRAHEAALQKYFEQVGKLLIDKPLHRAAPGDNLSTGVRAQTLAVLEALDSERKRILLQFLHESNLILRDKPVVSLAGAYLREANLREAKLIKADLRGADLSGANLS